MNAPENINTINAAHGILLRSEVALSATAVAAGLHNTAKPNKAHIKDAERLLKELNGLGLIEMEPRAGGVPFYRLIVASESVPKTLRATIEEHEANDAGEAQWLAPEDYEMPPADPVLLAMANRVLGDRLEGVAHVLRGCGLPLLADASGAEDLQPKVAALSGAYQMALADLRQHEACLEAKDAELLAQAKVVVDMRDRLDALTQQWEALQEQDGVDVKDAAVGYLIRVTKRKPRYVTQPERALDAALAAVRAGAGRAEVLAVVPVGVARRGAEWRGSAPQTKGD